MAKYKIHKACLSVHIKGNLYKKEQNKVFDSKIFGEVYLDSLVKAGFLEKIETLKEAKKADEEKKGGEAKKKGTKTDKSK